MTAQQIALRAAILFAIREVGLSAFKQTSLFMSSRALDNGAPISAHQAT